MLRIARHALLKLGDRTVRITSKKIRYGFRIALDGLQIENINSQG